MTKSSLVSNDLRTKASGGEGSKRIPISKDSGDFVELSTTAAPVSSSDPMAKLKSKRRLNNTIGGPVISSGLAGKRDPRSRHSTGRLSSSLGAKSIGSLFGDEDESKDMSVAQTQKLDARDDNVSYYTISCRVIYFENSPKKRHLQIHHFANDQFLVNCG